MSHLKIKNEDALVDIKCRSPVTDIAEDSGDSVCIC